MNEKMTRQANKKRIAGPTFKEGDKVFLLRKNIKTKRPSRKLDHVRIGPFEIEKQVGPVNFKLRLPKKMRIHPVFHVSLLEPAPHDALLETDIEVEPEQDFEVEEILDKKKINGQWKYLVKWEGYPPEDRTWEPVSHLKNAKEAVAQFHSRYPNRPSPADLPHGDRSSRSEAKGRARARPRRGGCTVTNARGVSRD
jgi:hypothetical protein